MFLRGSKIHNGMGGQGKRKRVVGLIAVSYPFILKLLLPLLGERRNRKSSVVCSLHAKLVVYVKSSFPLGKVASLPRLNLPSLLLGRSISNHYRARLVRYLHYGCTIAVTLAGCYMGEELVFIVDGSRKKTPDNG